MAFRHDHARGAEPRDHDSITGIVLVICSEIDRSHGITFTPQLGCVTCWERIVGPIVSLNSPAGPPLVSKDSIVSPCAHERVLRMQSSWCKIPGTILVTTFGFSPEQLRMPEVKIHRSIGRCGEIRFPNKHYRNPETIRKTWCPERRDSHTPTDGCLCSHLRSE
jgi:hypothetical protein